MPVMQVSKFWYFSMKNSMYNEHASDYARVIKDNSFNAHFERPSLLSLLPELQGKSVLDLGCGPGEYFEFFLNEKCSHITAVDVSQSMIKIVKERYGTNINSYKQNLNMGIPKEKDSIFDLVVSSLTIHYIKNISFLFKEVYRVLKKNGLLAMLHPLTFMYIKTFEGVRKFILSKTNINLLAELGLGGVFANSDVQVDVYKIIYDWLI